MGDYYLDSSALAKRYVEEQGSQQVRMLLSPGAGNTIYSVRITGAEVVAALTLRARVGTLAPASVSSAIAQFKVDFRRRYEVIEVTEALVESAMTLAEKHGLRGYDSVQLAAVLALHLVRQSVGLPRIVFVSADTRLNQAALDEGILIENPAV
jgi:uncharacterized protein